MFYFCIFMDKTAEICLLFSVQKDSSNACAYNAQACVRHAGGHVVK